MRFLNCLKNKRAQIVLPAILLVPTILLVIYLLFETAKLSRFKIRSQFALDSAAFIEMTSYSNFLNAVAYTNGAFPFRLFRDNLTDKINKVDDNYDGPPSMSYYDLFYQAGAFPAMADVNSNPKDNSGKWELKYKEAPSENDSEIEEGKGRPKNWNTENPKINNELEYAIDVKEYVEHYDYFYLVSEDEDETPGQENNKEDKNAGIQGSMTAYIIIYKGLENIYESQKKVYERLIKDGELFRKSFYYNSSSCKLSQCGKEGIGALKNYNLELDSVRLDKIAWFIMPKGSEVYKLLLDKSKPEHKKFMPLYQFSYLTKPTRSKMKKLYTGVDIHEPIIPPNNYFGVNVKKYAKKLHVRAALQCTNESNNCVWPNPTPKYQVRLYP